MSHAISIVMPMFNAAKYVTTAIESVLIQTYSNWELIIIDDHSTDNSVEIVQSIAHPKIRLLHNKSNMGAHATVNHGYKEVRGDYVCNLDADDLMPMQALEHRLECALKNKKKLVHSGLTAFYPNKTEIYFPPLDTNNIEILKSFLKGERHKKGINANSMLFERSCLDEIGLRNEDEHRFNADYEFALRLSTTYPSAILEENTYFYRFNEKSTLQTNKKKKYWHEHINNVEKYYLDLLEKNLQPANIGSKKVRI